jgi:hypothetical protein
MVSLPFTDYSENAEDPNIPDPAPLAAILPDDPLTIVYL